MYAAHGVGEHPRQRSDYKVSASVETGLAPSPSDAARDAASRVSTEIPRVVPGLPALYWKPMRPMLRFLWNSTRGHRIAPWRSPYLLWRIETYTGVKMTQIGFLEFWEFLWTERSSLWRFLKWTAEMDRYVHPGAKNT